jgi:CheY-like chemotaxis protein
MNLANARIMVVEDEDMTRSMIMLILKRYGVQHISDARDGIECLEKISSEMPDVIMMDLHLPRLNGWGALSQLRSDPATAHIPVLAFTVDTSPETVHEAMRAGFASFLPKPVRPQDVLEHLTVVIAGLPSRES